MDRSKSLLSGVSGSATRNTSDKNLCGNGNRMLAQIPCRFASSSESHRAIPRLCTTMISGCRTDGNGLPTTTTSSSRRVSNRLPVRRYKPDIGKITHETLYALQPASPKTLTNQSGSNEQQH